MKDSITFDEEPEKKKIEKITCDLCCRVIKGKIYRGTEYNEPLCYDCAIERGIIKPKTEENIDLSPAPTNSISTLVLLAKYKQLLEQLVQKQNFWTKGKNVRNDGPRMWDLLQQTATILNDPIPDNVKAKVQQLGGKV